MARIAAIGEVLRVQGFGLAGALVCPAEGAGRDTCCLGRTSPRRRRGRAYGLGSGRARGRRVVFDAPDGGDVAVTVLDRLATTADSLAPVRTALLDGANADSASLLAAADADTAAALLAAQQEVASLRAEARAQGEADGAAILARERNHSRRRAREIVLAARRDVYDELVRRSRAAASALRDDAAYAEWLAVLRKRASAQLGEDVTVSELAAGGVVAVGRRHQVEYGLAGLADNAVERLGPAAEELWQP